MMTIEPGAYVNFDGRLVHIAGRTADGTSWWSIQGDWYNDQGRFVFHNRETLQNYTEAGSRRNISHKLLLEDEEELKP